jgi:hypothetical protein
VAPEHVTLHIEKAQAPGNILTVLDFLAQHSNEHYSKVTDLIQAISADYDYIDNKGQAVQMARLLGLLDARDVIVTPRGAAVQRLRGGARADALHFLLYTGSTDAHGTQTSLRGRAWLYRAACDWLWAANSGVLHGAGAQQLAADLVGSAQLAFPEAALPAISAKTIGGVRAWLAELDPPVLHAEQFSRRDVCSRELFALALGQLAHAHGAQLDVDLLLDAELRNDIARLCLIEPATFDRRLDQAVAAFPQALAPGSRAGAYGRFVRLHAFPTIELLSA